MAVYAHDKHLKENNVFFHQIFANISKEITIMIF